ncbi:Crp/Fnr family transcriptional regulator [Larkinella humicola]|uniref:Crp/Fnr family transcriptional regulator n=1 Tax=Larkinella humicola TaxID=2607654 RepID=A0A5N1J0Z7_9BACT|nr:Crp/Fnr family transcriptional regulator [Larkinella humicola]KAA9340385.1 Crp/Fnr family transcriptional regulator [Larkinella humicola]
MELLDFVKQRINLGPELETRLDLAFKREECPKGHQLLQPDNFSKKVFFIEKGLCRTYYVKDGKDITHYFFLEDSFNMPIESIFYGKPSPYGLELLENCVVRTAQYGELEKYIDSSSSLEKLIRLLLIDQLKAFSDRMYAIQFQSAQERYRTLIDNHPGILQRAPLGHIASYLGITQQTLSVIRAQK